MSQTIHPLEYKGISLKQTYKSDFICFGRVLLEIKAVSCITDEHRAQTLNYLNATGLKVALIINFGHHPKAQFERIEI